MKAKLYNKLPQSLIKKIPKGKTVVFRLCNIREDVEKMVKDVDLELRPMTIKQKTFTKKHDWF